MNLEPLRLSPLEIGGGVVNETRDGWRLQLPAKPRGYADAQIDDHRQLPRPELPWSPPLELSLRARASVSNPQGTLGFGFWNDPFALSLGAAGAARKLPAAPQALWFFYGSPANDLSFTESVPGSGWKAVSLRTPALPSPLLAGPAVGAFLLSLIPGVRWPVMKAALRIASASEARLEVELDKWHKYRLRWERKEATFWVDDRPVLTAPDPPPDALGLVLWIDNQYAVASPRRGLRFGVVPTEREQWLEIEALSLLLLDTA